MRTITVHASKQYTITIGSGVLSMIGEIVEATTNATQVCIVSDSNVWPLYGHTVSESLKAQGLNMIQFIFPAGESSKNIDVYSQLLHFLSKNHVSREDCIVALGGGVVGDLAGFAAATYLRGIPYIQIPTSLLAMVDSSVGGKTGIDLPAGKNLCGAFYQPWAVLCDTETLDTLPPEVFRDGCAEVIKYAILYDPALAAYLDAEGILFDREYVIAQCIVLKRDAVEQDEFDRGARKFLNLGHTVGHAIETCSDYSVSHGNAVAIGIAVVCRAFQCRDTGQILHMLNQFCLPTSTHFTAEVLAQAALSDKKRGGDCIDWIIPNAIGDCAIVSIRVENLKSFIEEGL